MPATAGWVLHVDVEALLASEAIQEVGNPFAEGGYLEEVGELEATFGLELGEDVRSFTSFGGGRETNDEVVLLTGGEGLPAALTEHARTADGEPRTETHGERTLHLVQHGETTRYAHAWLDGEDHLLLVGDAPMPLVGALAVVAGEAPSAKGERELERRVRSERGGFLQGAATEAGAPFAAFGIGFLKGVGSEAVGVTVVAGESRGKCFLEAELEAADSDGAREAKELLEGLTALFIRAAATNPDAAESERLLSALKFKTSRSSLHVEFRYPTDKFGRELRAIRGDPGD